MMLTETMEGKMMKASNFVQFMTSENIEKNAHDERFNLIFTHVASKDTLYLRTDIGCWKIIRVDTLGGFILYHMNHPGKIVTLDDLIYGKYHRQVDVVPSYRLRSILKYIEAHDEYKKGLKKHDRRVSGKTKRTKVYVSGVKKHDREKKRLSNVAYFKRLEREKHLFIKYESYDLCG